MPPQLPVDGPARPERFAGLAENLQRLLGQVWGQGALAAAGMHLLFLLLFKSLGVTLLVWTNLASIAIHLGCYRLAFSGRPARAATLLVLEVVAHAALASRLVGLDSGFQFYILTLILPILITVAGSVRKKLLGVAALGLAYGVIDAVMRHLPPVHALDRGVTDVLRCVNLAGMLAVMTVVSLKYYQLVIDSERSLHALATTDPLTGLHNRRRLVDIAARARRESVESRNRLCFLLCDVDHFKQINDRHGHEVGDRALQQIGQVLQNGMRDGDIVARWGGEEFLMLVIDADIDLAVQMAERLRRELSGVSIELPGATAVKVTATFGVARMRDGDTIEAAIARADRALYRGKMAGRDRVVTEPDIADAPAMPYRVVRRRAAG